MPVERIYALTDRFLKGETTEEENAELARLVGQADNDEQLADLLSHAWQRYEPSDNIRQLADSHLKDVPARILASEEAVKPAPVVSMRKTWLRIAAVFLLVIAGAITWYSIRQADRKPTSQLASVQADLLPGGKKATLTLANGSVIELDSSANGNLASQGDVKITKQGGILTYTFSEGKTPVTNGADVNFNTVATPRGGEYSVILPDGSRAWLNAASSIRFPTSFPGNERRVEITGEVYLEVKPTREKKPFIVDIKQSSGKQGEVAVLGTKFNINAYPDLSTINTTLVEGKVMVSAGNREPAYLAPGQQGRISNDRIAVHTVDTEPVMAWHNGQFAFVNADIHEVMQQLERWYDIEVFYAAKVPDERFEGTIPRSSTIDEIFSILELSKLRVKREGRKVTVLP
ncbi:hypothetical protein OI18_17380 [Flavihumibacter solisilvae]|uniref:Iron dicitrate transport regulator FecR n=1 Tax=Flavihumibacter solisilvae TaxID=1349421 RepID=A0A0C1ISY8_9BACT|nr:hypothetical protein OI18_17380 [Flavihumibacter solisilvae]